MKFSNPFKKKASATSATIAVNPGQPVWTPRDYKSFADEAYSKNVAAYQCINRIADAIASVELEVWKGAKLLSDHPVLELLKNPNPAQSGVDLIRAKVSYLMIAGNAYDERLVVGGKVRELYTLRPDRMNIIESNNGVPAGFTYTVGMKKATFDVDERTGECDINHLKLFNPLNDWYGQSPVEAGAYAIDQHNESMSWMQSLLQNSAVPSGVYTVKEELGVEAFNRLKLQIDEKMTGTSKGRPLLVEGGATWQTIALSPLDLNIIENKYSAARDVCLAFGVPPQLLGIPGDNTYSNYAEARLAFYEDTVLPLLDLLLADWNNWLTGGEVDIKANLDKVPAIADKRAKMWEMADKSEDLTVNERRSMKGYPDIIGGDRLQERKPAAAISPELAKSLAYGD